MFLWVDLDRFLSLVLPYDSLWTFTSFYELPQNYYVRKVLGNSTGPGVPGRVLGVRATRVWVWVRNLTPMHLPAPGSTPSDNQSSDTYCHDTVT